MSGLIASIMQRPYVFAFLTAYVFLAWRLIGWRRMLLWLASGYLIAWASEFSSIHTGFPYGEYHYVYENMPSELMIAGVPFFDSLSYTFLTFAGYAMATFVLGRKRCCGILAVLLGALLTMLLDVIIDPIATMGEMWFLGKIHYYAHPGWYFGVPLTNFGGWFLVAFAIVGFNALAWHAFPRFFGSQVPGPRSQTPWLYPAFYTGIAAFNIAMSFWIGQWKLGLVSGTILSAILIAAAIKRRCVSQGAPLQG